MAGMCLGPQRLTFASIVLLSAFYYGAAQTQVCTYYDNKTIYSYQPYTEFRVVVSMNSAAVSGSGLSTTISSADIDYISFKGTLISLASPDVIIRRTVEMIDSTAIPPILRLTTYLSHEGTSSSASLSSIVFTEDISQGLQAYWTSTFIPGLAAAGVTVTGRTSVEYIPTSSLTTGHDNVQYILTSVTPGQSATLRFDVEPSGKQGIDLASGVTHFDSFLSFNDTSALVSFGPLDLSVCLEASYVYNTSVLYEHGFTALTFFIALLLGFLLVVLGVFLYLVICSRRKRSVSPAKYDENRMKEKGKKIVMDPKAALRKGLNIIKDCSLMAWDESIVMILALKDKLHMFREIDNLDVLATMHVDTELEQEQNDAAIQTSLLLIQGLRHNGDINKQTEDRVVANFNNNLKDLEKKLDAEYKKELEVVYTDLSAKNKEKLAELLQKHRQQKQQAITLTKELPEKERQSLLKMIDQQQEMEENELTFTLSLEQNEEAEKLRKEFAIRKRMGIKELQQGMMSEVITQGQLHAEQADWLMKEHKKQQDGVHRMYDEEISRQRMVLEEKLARRRALAQASETQEDDTNENLNLTAGHIVGFLQKGRKNGVITAEQSEEWIEEMKAKALAVKTDMETANETRVTELHKKLSQAKITLLNDLKKKHVAEVQEYLNNSKTLQSQGPVDPVSYAEGLLKLKSQHRLEQANLENQLDGEHAKQLVQLREQLAEGADGKLSEVERETILRLQAEGMTEKVVATLMKKHEAEKEGLRNTHEKNRRNQDDKLKEELARRRREWNERREKERQEQEDLREHEAEVVEQLVNSQVSMSEAERDRIMKEHEKQMVLLENSLTLNKLRQQRALEERLNQKRSQQMSKLQSQQQTEVVKQRKIAENNGEEDDEETHRAALELMKKHAQQRIAVMQGQQLNIDEELEEIRIEMTKERALALKGQEERLGAMITALQMEKAREMARIEEQQKAINNLKANLMDDLNARGILSTPECERILDVHRQESEALNQKLESQRTKQEAMLRAKMQERLQQREHLMLARQESELRDLMERPGNKMASKVRRVMLIHKHMVEMEKFRNRMDREITQSLADIRQQFEVAKLRRVQEQELAFVAGLVRVGCFNQNELLDVLHMLFPGKTEEDIQEILQRIMDGTQKDADKDMRDGRRNSTIVERIYQAQYCNPSLLNRTGSVRSMGGSMKKKKLSKKGSRSSITYPSSGTALGTINEPDDRFADSRLNDGVGVYDRRRSARNSITGYNNPAYDEDYARRSNTRNSISGNYGGAENSDHYQHRGSTRRVVDDSYSPNYDEGMDYVALGASMGRGDDGSAPSGRLPPLQDPEQSTKKKKKKKGLLKRHQQLRNVDDL